jgi:hypothetical protein
VSKDQSHHDKWLGFAESKIKNIVKILEEDRQKIGGRILELRTHTRAFNINTEISDDFACADVYYIGMRVRKNVEIKKELIDLTGSRRMFFEWIVEHLEKYPNASIQEMIDANTVDIKIDYRSREELPL